MRHVVIARHGGPDVLSVREAPDPVPGAGEVRIRVRAAGVNFADLMARMGLYPDAPKPPLVPGYEVSGIVDAVGAGVTNHREGERVMAFTPFGGYADAAVAPAAAVFAVPAGLSDDQAAAVPVNYMTAFLALYKIGAMTAGETVLIHGAAGGVGIAATQLARLRRGVIIGTASPGKHQAMRLFGVDHPLHKTNVESEVERITAGRGVDLVLDSIGGASFAASQRMLAPLGRLIMLGASGIVAGDRRRWLRLLKVLWRTPRFSAFGLLNRNRGVFGLNLAHLWDERERLRPAMDTLAGDFASGRLEPIVARTFPLDRAADAHRYMHSRANIGKVLLTV
jgi:synaptic vesicle membrane protein VAT-1